MVTQIPPSPLCCPSHLLFLHGCLAIGADVVGFGKVPKGSTCSAISGVHRRSGTKGLSLNDGSFGGLSFGFRRGRSVTLHVMTVLMSVNVLLVLQRGRGMGPSALERFNVHCLPCVIVTYRSDSLSDKWQLENVGLRP